LKSSRWPLSASSSLSSSHSSRNFVGDIIGLGVALENTLQRNTQAVEIHLLGTLATILGASGTWLQREKRIWCEWSA